MARARVSGGGERLSPETAHFYARVYGPARSGCMAGLRRAGCGEEEAEDIFAATFERIMRTRDPLREGFGPAQTVALLKRACQQKLIDERRHRDVIRMVPLPDGVMWADASSEAPEEAAEERESVAHGREAIASLPARDRRVFLQRHQLGLGPEEIRARNPGLSARSYRKILQRANARALRAYEEIAGGERCAAMRATHLRRYVSEEAGEREAALVEAHLEHCRACRLGVARLEGRLREVAAGLAVLSTSAGALGRLQAEVLARAGELAERGEHVIELARAGRERLRELALRASTALPGSGGESAAGQIVGLTGVKAASACAAGVMAAGCLAAGAVPGVGGLGLLDDQDAPKPVKEEDGRGARKPSPAPPPEAEPVATPSAEPTPSAPSAGSGRRREEAAKKRSSATRSAERDSTPTPTNSAEQVAEEFGVEAGAGTPAPVAPSEGAGTSGGQSGGGSGGAGKKSSPGSSVAAEFGL